MKQIFILLIISFAASLPAQVMYDPTTRTINMSLDIASRLDSLARMGKECSESMGEAESLVEDLLENKKYNEKAVESMQNSIMFAKQSLSLLEKEIKNMQIENATLKRDANMFKLERDAYRKEIARDTWGKAILGGGVIAIAAAVIISNLKR